MSSEPSQSEPPEDGADHEPVVVRPQKGDNRDNPTLLCGKPELDKLILQKSIQVVFQHAIGNKQVILGIPLADAEANVQSALKDLSNRDYDFSKLKSAEVVALLLTIASKPIIGMLQRWLDGNSAATSAELDVTMPTPRPAHVILEPVLSTALSTLLRILAATYNHPGDASTVLVGLIKSEKKNITFANRAHGFYLSQLSNLVFDSIWDSRGVREYLAARCGIEQDLEDGNLQLLVNNSQFLLNFLKCRGDPISCLQEPDRLAVAAAREAAMNQTHVSMGKPFGSIIPQFLKSEDVLRSLSEEYAIPIAHLRFLSSATGTYYVVAAAILGERLAELYSQMVDDTIVSDVLMTELKKRECSLTKILPSLRFAKGYQTLQERSEFITARGLDVDALQLQQLEQGRFYFLNVLRAWLVLSSNFADHQLDINKIYQDLLHQPFFARFQGDCSKRSYYQVLGLKRR